MYILGISGNFFRASADPAAVLVQDNRLVAAAEEERFTRVKHAPSQMPEEAIRFCLRKAGISIQDVDVLAFPQTTWRDIEANLRDFFVFQFGGVPKSFEYVDHHAAHAASAYRFSGYNQAIILTADWSGDGMATTISAGTHGNIHTLKRLGAPDHSLGVFYGVMTQYLGFKKWEDEYKVMGLASYGQPTMDFSWLAPDAGSDDMFSLDRQYLHPAMLKPYPAMHGLQQPGFSQALVDKVGPSRIPRAPITEYHKTVAASVQKRLEEVAEKLIRWAHAETGFRNVCIAGGVGLNCSMNGALLGLDCVDNLYVPPVASDSGIALGAAAEVAWRHGHSVERMDHAFYGPAYGADEIRMVLDRAKLRYEERPHPCPFMTITFDVIPGKRSTIPAVTHVDGTARVQTVSQSANGRYYDLISRFGELTGVPVVLNTSMNVMGDPMTMKPVDALRTFFATGLDHLAIGDFVVSK